MVWAAVARLQQQAQKVSRNAWLFLWTVFLSNVGLSGIFMLLYNLYLVQLGYREDFIGLLSFVQTGAMAFAALPSGNLAPRFGYRNMLLWGTVVMGLSSLLLCVWTSPALLVLLNAVLGAGLAMRIVPYTPYLVRNSSRAERTLLFAANSAAISAAGLVGSIVGGQLPELFRVLLSLPTAESIPAYRGSLIVGAAVGLLAALPMALADEETPGLAEAGAGPAQPANSRPTVQEGRRLRAQFVTVTVLFAVSAASIAPFTNVFYSRVLGLSAGSISLIFAASSVLAAIGTVAASQVAGRAGKVRTMILLRFAGAPLLLVLAFYPKLWVAVPALLVRNITEMAGWPLDGAFLAEIVPLREQAATVGWRSVAWNLAWALTSFVAGQVIVVSGYAPLFLCAGLSLSLASLAYQRFFGQYRL
jgi:MFS family permease